jgi:hypothetical protein
VNTAQRRIRQALVIGALLAPWLSATAWAGVLTIVPSADNTLFRDATGSLSDGAGPVLFAGTNGQGLGRRALLRFDLAGLPAGATIDQVTLALDVSNAPNTTLRTFTLHRVTQDWGEGASNTTSGAGAPATDGDATWLHAFWPDRLWASAGGDFIAQSSASQEVGGVGFYSWTDPRMVADVRAWIADGSSNHGWLVLGDESALNTARRFESRESAVVEDRPTLTVLYSAAVGVGSGNSPFSVTLGPCVPNPASGRAWIELALDHGARGRLDVLDLEGRVLANLASGWMDAGRRQVFWDGRDERGNAVSPGVYFCRLAMDGGGSAIVRVVRLR